MKARAQTVMCPSASCEDGALVLGRVGERRVTAFATRPVRLDADQAAELRARGDPERAFRFAAPCARSGCGQWSDGRCGVIEAILGAPQTVAIPPAEPSCLIRERCRWHLQRGAEACAMCRFVVTDNIAAEAHPAL